MKINIVSPHIDDAAFCLGLTIGRCIDAGAAVEMINCFTVTKWTCVFVSRDVEAVSRIRKAEDAAFNSHFNDAISITNLDLLDAPLRHGYVWQTLPFLPDEWELVAVVRNYLQAKTEGYIFCPLSIGFHIDHSIVREAVVHLYSERRIIFYEDLPYAQRISNIDLATHLDALSDTLGAELLPMVVEGDGKRDKGELIKCYQTQLNDEIFDEIVSYQQTVRGERLWANADVLNELRAFLK